MTVPKIGLPWTCRPILFLFLCFELIKQSWLTIHVHYYIFLIFTFITSKLKQWFNFTMTQFYNDSAYSLFAIFVNV